MRLVEVVMLMGAHCVSPVEHSQMSTDAAKVQCAVVIEKDTDRGTLTVTPGGAARDPQVMAAVERFRLASPDPLTSSGTRIVPAWAPAGSPATEVKQPPVAMAAVPGPTVPPAILPQPVAPPPDMTVDAKPTVAVPLAATAAPVKPAAPMAVAKPAEPAPAGAAARPATVPEKKVASLMPPPQKRPPARQAPARRQVASVTASAPPKASGQCRGNAVPRWYKAADGHRKYRCVKPTGDSAPGQIY